MRIRILSTGKIIVADAAFAEIAHKDDWEAVSESSPFALSLAITADKQRAAVNESIAVAASLNVFGMAVVAPVTDSFAVPIEDSDGKIVKVKAVDFVNGDGVTNIAFDKSGFYRITEAGINRNLPPGQRIALPQPFEIIVYE